MTSSTRLRVGLIGAAGRWGPSAHIPALQALPETELYAVCTAHEETARAAAQRYGVEMAYHDDKAMDADPRVEAAAVVVRVPAHYALTKNALEAGKHVYCEWPLGANLKETEELAALARNRNVHTMVGLQRRASPVYLRMQELVAEGYVGQVLAVNLLQISGGALNRTSDRTWQRDASLGANTLTIGFGHSIDALCMVAGEITEVSGIVSTQTPQWYETDTQRYVALLPCDGEGIPTTSFRLSTQSYFTRGAYPEEEAGPGPPANGHRSTPSRVRGHGGQLGEESLRAPSPICVRRACLLGISHGP